jgi:hypothetical protein
MTGSFERFSAGPSRPYPAQDERSASFAGGAATRAPANPPPKATSRTLRFAGIVVLVALLVAAVVGSFYFVTRLWSPGSNGASPSVISEPTGSIEHATVIFSGKASELTASAGNTITEDPSSASVVWIRSSLKTAKSSGATDGISIKVPISLARGLEGKRIRVTISAARGENAGASAPFAVAYSTQGAGNSGWRVFEADKQFKDFSMNYVVPRGAAGLPNYVAIWSDIAGRDTPLAVRSVTITGLP